MDTTEPDATCPDTAALLALLDELGELCRGADRADLAERLAARRRALGAPSVYVVVAGDYKAGKSSLVNALVGTDLCPVDDDVATVVPTLIRYAAEPAVLVRQVGEGGDARPVATDALGTYVSEAGNPANSRGITAVEVGVPSPLLRDGLVLVDTPGVGGLGSDFAAATLGSLAMAHAVLFVSDATQEYTSLELDFLDAARQACPDVMPVLTKVDVFPDWDAVRANNEAWLASADVNPDLVPISTELSHRARRATRPDLEVESGLPVLVERLGQVRERGRARMAAAAATEVHAVTSQLAAPLRAEQGALADPSSALAGLVAAEDDARQLAGDTADWLVLLEDGISDLAEDMDHEVSRRLLDVRREAERTVTATDPSSAWDEIEAALTRRAAAEVAAAAQAFTEAAGELGRRIAEHFAEHEAVIAPALPVAGADLGLPAALEYECDGGPLWRGELFEAGWGGAEAMSAIAGMLSISVFNPFAVVIGVLMGGRTVRQARQRELQERRQQAMQAVDRYLEEARREVARHRQSALRRIRRELLAFYRRRAGGLYRSARDSLAAAQRTLDADRPALEARAAEVATALGRLRAIDGRAQELAATLVARHGGGA
ncbi:MAG: dynamin family protein [Acidimicrobiia bacterium]